MISKHKVNAKGNLIYESEKEEFSNEVSSYTYHEKGHLLEKTKKRKKFTSRGNRMDQNICSYKYDSLGHKIEETDLVWISWHKQLVNYSKSIWIYKDSGKYLIHQAYKAEKSEPNSKWELEKKVEYFLTP